MNAVAYSYTLEQLNLRNPLAFTRLYREHKDQVFTFLMIKTKGNTQIAEEVLCDTFHSAIKSAPGLRNTVNINGWLLQIASRRLSDYLKKMYRDISLYDDYDDNLLLYETCTLNQTDCIQTNQERLFIKEAFDNLNERHKAVMRLKYIECKSVKEIARFLNKKHTAVDCLLARARKALREEFNKTTKINNFDERFKKNKNISIVFKVSSDYVSK